MSRNQLPPLYADRTGIANMLGISARTLSRKVATDPSFPRPVCFGGANKRWLIAGVVVWAEEEAAGQKKKMGRPRLVK